MHALFISACEKKAVRRSRAILDSYAIRAGERCWISAMTLEGLQSIRAALAQGATRQTAVACYQNDGYRRMKLLWIVGAHGRFGPDGHFSSGRRRAGRPVVIPGWVRLAALVARLSGLQHDWGKLSLKFQNKLRGKAPLQDAVRHEWISLKLAQAVRDGLAWSEAWQGICPQLQKMRLGERILSDAAPHFPASALECTDALIATHHGLFEKPLSSPGARLVRTDLAWSGDSPLFTPWNGTTEPPFPALLNLVQNLQTRLRKLENGRTGPEWTPLWRVLFLYARTALIFADQTISAQKMPPCPDKAGEAFANTDWNAGSPYLKQLLEDHLRQVAERAGETVWRMAALVCSPEASLCGLEPCALASILRPAEEARFVWQNTAADALSAAREQYQECGVLLFNGAGTGSGKTRMNVRAACLLSRNTEPRLSIALNLRSLTLQTGRAMQRQLGLDDNDCATVIGDRVALRLFQSGLEQHEETGEEETEILTSGGEWPLPAWLEAFLTKPRERRLLGAPLLVSTVDFLVAAGDPSTQGHGVKALLRLMSADLILDEVDAYEPEPLAAVLRLVQLSALFGRNVFCSSATLSKPVRQALEAAYASGARLARRLAQDERAESPERPLYLRAMIDNVLAPSVEAVPVQASPDAAEQAHAGRIAEQIQASRTAPVCRLAELVRLDEESVSDWLEKVVQAVCRLHERHAFSDQRSGVKLSFGLVRVANIGTAVEVARYLAHALPHARIACYHAGDWRISRFYKEQRLDALLSRAKGDAHILVDPEIRRILDQAKADRVAEVPFVVVATPVEEVGRDHDFDWGVLDVSSAQSLVQVAGRINRHREQPVGDKPNIAVLQFNWRHCRNQDRGQKGSPAFCWPGYEGSGRDYLYRIHDLAQILPWDDKDQMVVTTAVRLDVDTSQRNTSCRLAAREDKAIQKRLAPYFGSADGDFLVEPVPATLLFSQIYKNTALCPTSGKPELWRLGRDEEGKTCYERYEVDMHGTKVWVAQGRRTLSVTPALPNAWLCLDAEAMRDLCRKTGVDEEDAMTVELLAYHQEDGEWEYDQGFGIRRRPT